MQSDERKSLAEEIGCRVLEVLLRQAAANRESGNRLRAQVRTVMNAHTAPCRLTAKLVLEQLNVTPAPSIRRVQEVMQEIRASSSVSR